MIFVTLGTQDKNFDRLLKTIDKALEKGIIKEKVIVQAGYTKYESTKMEIFESLPKDEFEKLMKKADLVITHGGVGSIITALKYHKKVIAAPRLKKYQEHTNDHQKEIIEEFAKEGYIIPLKDFTKFDKVLAKAKKFRGKEYKDNSEELKTFITSYIDDNDHISWFNRDKKVILTAFINFLLFFLLVNFNLNIYLAFTISYVASCFLLYLLKNKKLAKPLTVVVCFYLIEGLFLLLLVTNLNINYLLAKLFINIIVIIIYHFLDKKN